MSFSVWPAFSFNLNRMIIGNMKFGRYDGIHACLTAATTSDKVILHNPHKRLNAANSRLSWTEANSDIAILNFNQEIRAIETGRITTEDNKEVLVIGSPSQLLVYHVDDNRDVFFKEIPEGIVTIILGLFSSYEQPLVIVGGNQFIRGYDGLGDEKLWIVTSGRVNTLSLFDINNDGKNEVICGCDNGTIKVYQNDTLLLELTENSAVGQICQIGRSNLMAYTVNDGTLGVYDESVRLWRIKSKTRGTALTSFDLLGTGTYQLIIGWESGKVDVRDVTTGENLFKLNFNQVITSVAHADYRGKGSNDLILCTKNGEVRGYEKSKINLYSIKSVDQNQLKTLMTTKKNLTLELSHYAANTKINKSNFEDEEIRPTVLENFGIIPANTRLQIAISTKCENESSPRIEITICTNNDTVIKAVIIFSEGIFDGEALIGYPYVKPTSRIVMPFSTPKDISYDIHIKVLVGYEKGQQFHVFELTRQLPKFSMYAISDNFNPSMEYTQPLQLSEDTSYVHFKLNERFQRICLWINQNFLIPTDIEPQSVEDKEELRLPLISLYDKCPVILWFYDRYMVKIVTKNMDLAGNLIQSLARFLNIEHLLTTAHFPRITDELNELFERIDGYETTYTNLTLDVAHKKNIAKNLLIQAEDARLYNEGALMRLYTNLNKINEDLIASHTIRQQNFVEMQKCLDAVNNILKSATKLRVGKYAASMMTLFKDAVKTKNTKAIGKIIEVGY